MAEALRCIAPAGAVPIPDRPRRHIVFDLEGYGFVILQEGWLPLPDGQEEQVWARWRRRTPSLNAAEVDRYLGVQVHEGDTVLRLASFYCEMPAEIAARVL